MPQIVTITERALRGAQPNLLQQKGTLISLGATSLPIGQLGFCADLQSLQSLVLNNSGSVQAFYRANETAPTIRGEAQKEDARLVTSPPIVGASTPAGLPFTLKDADFTNTADIPAGATTATLQLTNIATMPEDFIPSSLVFSNIRLTSLPLNGKAVANVTAVLGNETGSVLELTLTFAGAGGNPADIPANSAWEVDIAGSSAFDNTQSVAELTAMGRSWFANSTTGVYVLELGPAQPATMGTLFQKWFTAHPQTSYGYVFPRGAQNDPTLHALFAANAQDNSRVFFFLCGDPSSYQGLINTAGNGLKSVFFGAEYTGAAVGPLAIGADLTQEHLASAVCAQFLSARPSALNQLAPMSFRQLVGITPWPEAQNANQFARFKADSVGFGGVSRTTGTILFWGVVMNGDDMGSWYGADWTAITLGDALTQTIIDGSQSGQRPLIYNQEGINRLKATAQATLLQASTNGCILSAYTLTSLSFNTYVKTEPQDYEQGIYNGLAATVTPSRGFTSLTVGLEVDFTGQSAVTATTTNAGNTNSGTGA